MARHLALRMAYEDVFRVAQLKMDPRRMARIRAEIVGDQGVKTGNGGDQRKTDHRETLVVTEFLKPGIVELSDVLPPFLARMLLGWAARQPDRKNKRRGMHLRSTTLSGYLMLRLLAGLRQFRRKTWRYQQEGESVENWLKKVTEATALDPALGLEVAECGGLIRGYGETHTRGWAAYRLIEGALIEPTLAMQISPSIGAASIAKARKVALSTDSEAALREAIHPPVAVA